MYNHECANFVAKLAHVPEKNTSTNEGKVLGE